MSTFLDDAEIIQLTHKKRRHAQATVLRAMGIQHKVRPDGSLAISRDHINKAFDGAQGAKPPSAGRKAKTTTPINWDAI